jgi:hypothetical protein
MRLSFGIFEWAGRRAETRRRADDDRHGFRAKLLARSAALWLETPKILDADTHDDGLHGEGGVQSMRFETRDSASMLVRHVDIDLAAYPTLAWRWYIELPIRSPLDERTREGDEKRCCRRDRRSFPRRCRSWAGGANSSN